MYEYGRLKYSISVCVHRCDAWSVSVHHCDVLVKCNDRCVYIIATPDYCVLARCIIDVFYISISGHWSIQELKYWRTEASKYWVTERKVLISFIGKDNVAIKIPFSIRNPSRIWLLPPCCGGFRLSLEPYSICTNSECFLDFPSGVLRAGDT